MFKYTLNMTREGISVVKPWIKCVFLCSHSSTSASSSQLTDGGYRWEFMGDEGIWTEYNAHVSKASNHFLLSARNTNFIS